MEFLRAPALPSPFNIVPMPSMVANLFKKVFFCFFNQNRDGDFENTTGGDMSDLNAIEMPTLNGMTAKMNVSIHVYP